MGKDTVENSSLIGNAGATIKVCELRMSYISRGAKISYQELFCPRFP